MKKVKVIGIAFMTSVIISTSVLAIDFQDTKGHWAREAINSLSAKNVIREDDNGNFNPDDLITREEMATLIYRFMESEGKVKKESLNKKRTNKVKNSKDKKNNKNDKENKDYIKKLIDLDILSAYENGSLGSENKVTREEFATIIYRYCSKESVIDINKKGNIYDLNSLSQWAIEPVTIMIGNNIIKGDRDNYFRPQTYMTKAEVCQALYNISKREKEIKIKYLEAINDITLLNKSRDDGSPIIKNSELKKGDVLKLIAEENGYYFVKPTGIENPFGGYARIENFTETQKKDPDHYRERKMKALAETKLRVQPKEDAEFVGEDKNIIKDEAVLAIAETTDYYLIKPIESKIPYIGYAKKELFEEVDENYVSQISKNVVANKNVILKLQPLEDSDPINRNANLPAGTEFKIEGEATFYYLVRPINIEKPLRGYVLKEDLDEIK